MRVQGLVGNRATSRALGLDGRGEALPPMVRSEMEARFVADFGSVRLHTDAGAARLLRESNAEAATIGEAIAVPSRSAVQSRAGRRLIAHELAHVLQQRRGGDRPSPLAGSSLEAGAERAAAAFDGTASGRVSVDGASGVGVARQSIAPARSLDPTAMSIEELAREIQYLEQWLSGVNESSAERAGVESYLVELRRSLAARDPERRAPQRSQTSIWVDQALAWVVRQNDDVQAQFSQSMRNLAAGMPPAQFAMVDTAIGVADAIFDTCQSIMMFQIGILAGTGELIVDTVLGILKLAWFVFELLTGLVGDLIVVALRQVGVDARYQGKSGADLFMEALAVLEQVPATLVAAFKDWQARYRAAPPELKAAMLGRLVPEVISLLLAGVGAARLAGAAARALARTTVVRAVVIGTALGTARTSSQVLGSAGMVIEDVSSVGRLAEARTAAAMTSTEPAAVAAPATAAAPVAATATAPSAASVIASAPVAASASAAPALAPAAPGASLPTTLMSVGVVGAVAPVVSTASVASTATPAAANVTAAAPAPAPSQSVQWESGETKNTMAEAIRRQHGPFSSPDMWTRLSALLLRMRSASGIVRRTKSAVTPDVEESVGGNMAVALTDVEGLPNGGLVVGRSPEAGGNAQLGSEFSPKTDPVKLPFTHRHAEQELAERFAAKMSGIAPSAGQGKTLSILVEAVPCPQCMNDVLPALSRKFPGLTIEVKNLEGSRILRYRDGVLLNR